MSRTAARVAYVEPRFAVHAYGRQMWFGKKDSEAQAIVNDYARIGVKAKVKKVKC